MLREVVMGIFKDAGDSLLKYGGIIVNKTEEYTRIAKLTMDVKKYSNDVEKLQAKIGKMVVSEMEKSNGSMDLKDPVIKKYYEEINELKKEIQKTKEEIKKIKDDESSSENSSQTQNQDSTSTDSDGGESKD